MKTKSLVAVLTFAACIIFFSQCSEIGKDNQSLPKQEFGGFGSQVKWGEHLVASMGCEDCHSPRKLTPQGPVPIEGLFLSGHPSNQPIPDVDRKMIESNALITTQTLTEWIGPWGVSFAANLTPDATGIGTWQESNFITAIREGKFKGLPSGRALLPPMPWMYYKELTDDELKAIFAYLKTIKPINNVVPQPLPPVSSPGQ